MVLQKRQTGILLPISALPQGLGSGDFDDAIPFIDFLVSAGVGVWQLLPLGPTHEDCSPYLCLSAHAGNSQYIGLQWLYKQGLLPEIPDPNSDEPAVSIRNRCLFLAWQHFQEKTNQLLWNQYQSFIQRHADWLQDYADFIAIRNYNHQQTWDKWPDQWRDWQPKDSGVLPNEILQRSELVGFEQYLFFTQWQEIKNYAHAHGVTIFGDMPLFVAYDSADVWANRANFLLDANGEPTVVAGVPPDYFSDTGQRWGNPHYDWTKMAADNFNWWIQRARTNAELYDLVRIDHFRGLEAVWEIPRDAKTAEQGQWHKVPGDLLLESLYKAIPDLHFVAEDLGVITTEVNQLRDRFKLPGMAILQFAFDSDDKNPYLPENINPNTVVYTGTHDNNTSLGWYQNLPEQTKTRLIRYLGREPNDMPWPLIKMALHSNAQLAIIPLQDILSLDGSHRMNAPGTVGNNWRWRFKWEQLTEDIVGRLHALNEASGRINC